MAISQNIRKAFGGEAAQQQIVADAVAGKIPQGVETPRTRSPTTPSCPPTS